MELKALMSTKETMSSLQIAEITGKRHDNVIRDIRGLLSQGVSEDLFNISSYSSIQKKEIPCYLVSREGVSLLNMKYKNESLSKLVGHTYIGTITRFEHSFGELLTAVLSRMGLSVVTQVKVGNYRVDFYIPEVNVAIEYDEIQHSNPTNAMKDFCRETSIKEAIGCKFIRVSYSESDAYNLGIVLSKITKIKKVK